MAVRVIHADCLDAMRSMAEAGDTVHSIVTDPPYGLDFMGRAWDGAVPGVPYWEAALRLLPPGGYLLAFGGTRTAHRMAVAIEDAGFEIRDQIMWLYGSGFPKSLNLPGGLGTALKPAYEPIIVARKTLAGTVAANVLAHGTGALNIDASRVPTVNGDYASGGRNDVTGTGWGHKVPDRTEQHPAGRWPANILHDGSDEVLEAFAAYGERKVNRPSAKGLSSKVGFQGMEGRGQTFNAAANPFYSDTGTAARFFYSAKATAADRAGSKHPTVKPLALMRYLCRLVTPPGGTVLDPFSGSGTTLQAAMECGFNVIGIEQDAGSVADIHRRLGAMRDAAPLLAAAE
jgi:site-specific DNA-methyltransferase (adenine-specific)